MFPLCLYSGSREEPVRWMLVLSSLYVFDSVQHPKFPGMVPSLQGGIIFPLSYTFLKGPLQTHSEMCFSGDDKPIKPVVKIIHATIKLTVKITAIYLSLPICAMIASATCPHLTVALKWWGNGRTGKNRWRVTYKLFPRFGFHINPSSEVKGRW